MPALKINFKKSVGLKRFAFGLAVLWTLAIAASLTWNYYQEEIEVRRMARESAKALILTNVSYINWNAGHGGVYVPVTDSTKPNPYLEKLADRDLETTSKLKLTLISPPGMSKKIILNKGEGAISRFRLSDIDPVNPKNKADSSEIIALKLFKNGKKEYTLMERKNGKSFFRLIEPLVINKNCLKCHADAGYKIGDLKGSVSVSIPMEPYETYAGNHFNVVFIGHSVAWIFGVLLIFGGLFSVNRRMKEKDTTLNALLISEENYKMLVEKAGIAIVMDDIKGNIFFFNEKFTELFGYSAGELKNKKIYSLVHPDDRVKVLNNHKKRLNGEKAPSRYEIKGLRKDGAAIFLEVDVVELKEDGILKGTRAYIWDISDRKRMEEILIENEEKYRSLYNSIRDAILVADTDRNIIDCNSAFTSLFGYTLNEIKGGKTLIIYENEEEFGKLGDKIKERHGKGDFLHVANYRKKSGEIFPGETNVFYLKNEKGEVTGFIGLIRDVTKRKETEESLKEKVDKLERFNRVMVDRELRMVELKKEVNILLEQQGKAKKYNVER